MRASLKVNGSIWAKVKRAFTKPRRRRRNPRSAERAADFYRAFHWGEEPRRTVEATFPEPPAAGTLLGTLHAVTYETSKGGEKALWEHTFGEDGGAQPDLVADPDSKQLYIVGGDYDITERGIID